MQRNQRDPKFIRFIGPEPVSTGDLFIQLTGYDWDGTETEAKSQLPSPPTGQLIKNINVLKQMTVDAQPVDVSIEWDWSTLGILKGANQEGVPDYSVVIAYDESYSDEWLEAIKNLDISKVIVAVSADVDPTSTQFQKFKTKLGIKDNKLFYYSKTDRSVELHFSDSGLVIKSAIIVPESDNTGEQKNSFEYQYKGKRIRIANVHAEFSDFPDKHEEAIQQFIDKDSTALSVVVGDFNRTIVPPQLQDKTNITTGVAPAVYRKKEGAQRGERQGASAAIDGCTYSSPRAPEAPKTYVAAEVRQLNCATGEVYSHLDLPPLSADEFPEVQRPEVTRFVSVICLDSRYTSMGMISGNDNFYKYTLFDYQDYLRKEFSDNNILIRAAKNLSNEDGIVARLPDACYNFIQQKNDPRVDCRYNASTVEYLVSSSKENTRVLMGMIDEYARTIPNLKQKYKKYDVCYVELFNITKGYLNHLGNHPSIVLDSTEEIDLYINKKEFITEVCRKLNRATDGLMIDKMKAIDEVREMVSNNKEIERYRGPEWRRYIRNVGVVLACATGLLALPVSALLLLLHKAHYNTFRFWETTGYKEKQRLLATIEAAKDTKPNPKKPKAR